MSQPIPARTTAFFALVFLLTWSFQAPAALARFGLVHGPIERWLPLGGLGIFGPTIAALIATRLEGRPLRTLFDWTGNGRRILGWTLVGLAVPGLLLTGGLAIHHAVFGSTGPLAYPPPDAQRVVALLLVPLVEEIGWRGYALPRLQARHGPIRATVLLGGIWAVWHLPMLLGAGVPLVVLPLMLPFFVFGSFLFTWLSLRTGGSLLVAVAAHMGAHLDNSHLSLPGDATPAVVHTIAFGLLAIALVVFDRKRWARETSEDVAAAAA